MAMRDLIFISYSRKDKTFFEAFRKNLNPAESNDLLVWSDQKLEAGSKWEHRDFDDPKLVDLVGRVLESTPPRRLVVTWAFPADEGDSAKTSRVTYDIEPFAEGVVRLTVTHDELEPDSEMLKGITAGWPVVVSMLKTLLETGKVGAEAGRRSYYHR